MAALTRVVRRVAVVEEGRGQTFLEPLQETLARCRQTSSLYLTRSAGSEAARLRGDWLLAEVNRLVSEAEALDAADRAIEAKAVAALAEWRAASLRYAATATAAPPMAPPVAPPVPVEEEPAAADAATPTPDADAEPDDAEPNDGDQAHAAPEESGDAVAEDAEEAEEPDEPASTEPVRTTFRVQRNEGAWTIARKHGVEFADLLRWNGWSERETLQQGQEYVVYLPPAEARDAESPDDAEPERRVFRVQRGESLYALARKHGVTMDQMRAWNDWGRNPTLRVGQEYIVYLPAAD
jgi:LysM repeat protein